MRRSLISWRHLALPIVICLLLPTTQSNAQRRNKRYEEPKSQVIPLPRELPMVLPAETAGLTFYNPPLLKTGGLAAQIRRSISDLLRDTKGRTVIKLRAFVSGAGDARRVQSEVTEQFSSHRAPLPVLTILQVGSLGEDFAQVAFEAILSSSQSVNPNGLVFFSGQLGNSLDDAVKHLRKSAAEAAVAPEDMLRVTCFTGRLDNGGVLRALPGQTFPKAISMVVQAQRDPFSDRSSCQAVGRLGKGGDDKPLTLLANARATVVHAPRIVFTGLQLSFGSYLDDAREAFQRLQRAASAVNGAESPVEINAFSLDMTAGAAIRKSTNVPPSTFTDQTIEGLPSVDASAGIEAVLAPGRGPSW